MRTSTAALVLLLTACSATPEDAPAPTPSADTSEPVTTSPSPSTSPAAQEPPGNTSSLNSGPAEATVEVPETSEYLDEFLFAATYWSTREDQEATCDTWAGPSGQFLLDSEVNFLSLGLTREVESHQDIEYDQEVIKAILLSYCE